MKLMVILHEDRDYTRPTREFIEMLHRRYPGKEVEEIDLDTREGASTARAYGITDYPALIVSTDDGRAQNVWQGMPLPMIDEVAGIMLA